MRSRASLSASLARRTYSRSVPAGATSEGNFGGGLSITRESVGAVFPPERELRCADGAERCRRSDTVPAGSRSGKPGRSSIRWARSGRASAPSPSAAPAIPSPVAVGISSSFCFSAANPCALAQDAHRRASAFPARLARPCSPTSQMGRAPAAFRFIEEMGTHGKSLSRLARNYALMHKAFRIEAFFIDKGQTPVVLSRALYAGPYLEVRRHFSQRDGRAQRRSTSFPPPAPYQE